MPMLARPRPVVPSTYFHFRSSSLRHELGHAPQPVLIDRLAAARSLRSARRCPASVRSRSPMSSTTLGHASGSPTSISSTSLSWMCFSSRAISSSSVVDVLRDPRLHQRLDGGDEQVDDGLLRAAEAGAVAAGERQVVRLVEQDRLERADALFQVVDPNVLLRRGRQVEPEVPVLAQALHRLRRSA